MRFAAALVLPLVALSVTALQAHPGHQHEVVSSDSGWHYFLQPEHAMFSGVLMVLLAFTARVAANRFFATKRKLRPALLAVRRDL